MVHSPHIVHMLLEKYSFVAIIIIVLRCCTTDSRYNRAPFGLVLKQQSSHFFSAFFFNGNTADDLLPYVDTSELVTVGVVSDALSQPSWLR